MRPLLLMVALFLLTPDAQAGDACVRACRKVASCRLLQFNMCMKLCDDSTPQARQSTLVQARQSCSALGQQMASSEWTCIAEGQSSSGYNVDGYNPDYTNSRDIYMPAQGRTRDAAATLALRNCGAIMGLQLETGRSGSRETAITSGCHITKCIPPGRRSRGGTGASPSR